MIKYLRRTKDEVRTETIGKNSVNSNFSHLADGTNMTRLLQSLHFHFNFLLLHVASIFKLERLAVLN